MSGAEGGSAGGAEVRDVPAQIDTAADRTVVPHAVALTLGLHVCGKTTVVGFGGPAVQAPLYSAEVRRFAREQRREVLIAFRRREYSTKEYAYFACCVRTLFPWFCNSNGPRKRVLWGNPAPFPVANLITGCWAADVYALKSRGGAEKVVRPAVRPGRYFRDEYRGWRREALWPEKLLARYTHWRIRMRGSRGGLFFVDRRKLGRVAGAADRPIADL